MKNRKIDSIDYAIINTLQNNGRISNVDLAKTVNLSPAPCLERVRKLEKSGYITGYFAQIAVNKCELDLVAMIEVSLEHSHTHIYQDFHKAIINHDEIEGIYQIAGDFDYIIKVRSKNMESYRHFLWNILAQAPGVKGTRSHMVMETIYERQTPSLKYLKDSIDTP